METTTPETLIIPPPPKRNIFLLVICILTFVGSGFGILGAFVSYATANKVAALNVNYQEMADDQQTPSFLNSLFRSAAENSDPAKIKESALVALLSNLLTLFGAIMMLKLRKPGFYLYVGGILIYILVPILFIGGIIGTASALADGVIGIAFVVMYAVNLKSMTR